MAKFVGVVIGGLEIALGAALLLIGNPLGYFIIAAGAGQLIGGIGTLLNQPKTGLATASRNAIAPWNVIYGRAKVGGTIVYINEFGDTDKNLDLVMVLACHPCQSVDALLFDNQRVVFDPTTGSSRSPNQQAINITSITRTNDVVTVVLSQPFADVQDGDLIQIQNVSTDHSLNGQFYITQQSVTQFTYISGGAAVSLSNTGQAKTTFPDYRTKVHMEVLLGNHTATFPGMLNGTPYDGDPSSPVNVDNNPWTDQHLLLGKTAVFLRLHYNDQVFSGGLPNISFHVSGKNDIADPRNTVLARPNVLLNGWGNNAHVGAYEEGTDLAFNFGLNNDTTYPYANPGNACDGDLTTFAAAIQQHTHTYVGCVWSFPAGITSPTLSLNILSEIPLGQGYYVNLRSAGLWYSLDAGSTWTQIYNAPIHPKGWDCIALPSSQDSSKIQVMAFTDSHDDMVHYIYDIQLAPSPTSSGYNTNAALCIADYLTNTTWGFKAVLGTEVPIPELIAAANLCDESVSLADGATEPRYTCNGTFALTVRRGEVLQNLLTACAGRLTYSAGQFVIHPGAWVGSTLNVGSGDAWRIGAPLIVPATAATFELNFEDQINQGDQSFGNGTVQIVFDGHGGATIAFLGNLLPTSYLDDFGVGGTKLVGANVGPGPVAIPNVPAAGTELVVQIFSPDGTFVSGAASHNPDGLAHAYLLVAPAGYAPYAFDLLQSASGPFRWKSKASIRDLYNGIKGTYVSPANGWQTSDMPPYAQDQKHGYSNGPSQYMYDANLAADGGDRRWFEIQLPFTISPATAQRLAKIELLRRRQQGTGTFAFNLSLYQTTALDVITLSLPYLGWSNKLVEITAHRLTLNKQQSEGNDVTLLGCELDVQETDPSVYEWSASEELTPQGFQQSSLPNVSNPVAPGSVTASSGSATTIVGADGVARSRILVTWTTPADGYVTSGGQIQLQYQPVGATTWTALPNVDPTVTQAYIDGVTDGQQYVVQIRSVNAAGVPSAWVPTAAVTVSGSPSSLSVSSIAPAGATSGQVLTYNGTSWTPSTPTPPPVNHFAITWGIGIGQAVAVGNDVTPHYLVPFAGIPQEVTLAAKTAPAGADLIVDILHNGTSLFSAPVHLSAGQTQATSTALASGAVLAVGDLLTLNVTQVGSTTPGQDVTIQLLVQLNN